MSAEIPEHGPYGWRVGKREGLSGDAIVAASDDMFTEQRRNFYGDAVVEAAQRFLEHAAHAELGTPVLKVLPSRDANRSTEIDIGGKLTAPVVLERERGWQFVVTVVAKNYANEPEVRKIFYSLEELMLGLRNQDERLAIGEPAVAELVQRHRLYCLTEEELSHVMVVTDAKWLDDFSRTGLPLEFLELSDEERATVCEHMAATLLTHKNVPLQARAYRVLEYVVGARTPEQHAQLLDALNSQMADMLPLAPGDDKAAIYTSFALAAHQPRPDLSLVVQPGSDPQLNDIMLRPQTQRAAYLSQLYRMRAQQVEQSGVEVTQEEVVIPPWPHTQLTDVPSRSLTTFVSASQHSDAVRQDVAYLLELRAAGVPCEFAGVDHGAHREQAWEQFMRLLDNARELQEAVNILGAVEYLFGTRSEEQRNELYDQIRQRYAHILPVDEDIKLVGQTRAAEAMAEVMPQPPLGRDAPRAANAAALMADFYQQRAKQLFRKDTWFFERSQTRRPRGIIPLRPSADYL